MSEPALDALADSAGVKFGNAYDAGAERKFQAMR